MRHEFTVMAITPEISASCALFVPSFVDELSAVFVETRPDCLVREAIVYKDVLQTVRIVRHQVRSGRLKYNVAPIRTYLGRRAPHRPIRLCGSRGSVGLIPVGVHADPGGCPGYAVVYETIGNPVRVI